MGRPQSKGAVNKSQCILTGMLAADGGREGNFGRHLQQLLENGRFVRRRFCDQGRRYHRGPERGPTGLDLWFFEAPLHSGPAIVCSLQEACHGG
jgi:hypothetical protein